MFIVADLGHTTNEFSSYEVIGTMPLAVEEVTPSESNTNLNYSRRIIRPEAFDAFIGGFGGSVLVNDSIKSLVASTCVCGDPA